MPAALICVGPWCFLLWVFWGVCLFVLGFFFVVVVGGFQGTRLLTKDGLIDKHMGTIIHDHEFAKALLHAISSFKANSVKSH